MKKALLIILGALLFMALPSIVVWQLLDRQARDAPLTLDETEDQRVAAVESAFGGDPDAAEAAPESGSDAAPVEVDAATKQEVQDLFLALGQAARDGDAKEMANYFSIETILQMAEKQGLIELPRGRQRAAFLTGAAIGMRRGLSSWTEAMAWDDCEVRRIDRINDKELVAYVRLWDDALQTHSKMRWWLIKSKSKGWKLYDYEDFDTNLRMSTLISLGMAPGGKQKPWMKELVGGIEILSQFYQDTVNGYANTTEMEEFFTEFLEHQLPVEIEAFSRVMLATALLGQERYDETLEQLQIVEEVAGSEQTPMMHYLRGICLAAMERYDEALASYEKYANFLGWDADVLEMVADIYISLDDSEKAAETALRGLVDTPRAQGCFATLAVALPAERLPELVEHAENTGAAEESWELAIDYALEIDKRDAAEGLFAIFSKNFPESELLEHYRDSEDLGSGFDVTEWTLEDWLEDADFRDQLEDHRGRRQRFIEHLGELNSEQIVELVDFIALADQPWTASRILEAQGEAAVPALVAALDDPRFLEPVVTETYSGSGDFDPSFPVNRILNLLDNQVPADAVPSLLRLFNSEERDIRGIAAGVVASVGDTSTIPAVLEGLDDPNPSLHENVLTGLKNAAKAGRSSPEMIEAVWPVIESRVTAGDDCRRDIWALLQIDEERAISFLRGDEVLRVDHRELAYLLWALETRDVPINPRRLISFIETHYPKANEPAANESDDPDDAEYPSASVVAASIEILAKQAHPTVERWAEKVLDHEQAEVRDSGADALVTLAGLNDIDLDELYDETENEAVLEFFYTLDLIDLISDEMAEDGFGYYLFNEPSDIEATLDALDQADAKESRQLLEQAIAKLAPEGLPGDYEQLSEDLEKLLDDNEAIFNSLDEAWYRDPDRLWVLRQQYLIQFKEALIKEAKRLGIYGA